MWSSYKKCCHIFLPPSWFIFKPCHLQDVFWLQLGPSTLDVHILVDTSSKERPKAAAKEWKEPPRQLPLTRWSPRTRMPTRMLKNRNNTYLSHFPANPLVGHPDVTHWGDTLVGHPSYLTLLLDTLVRHSYWTLLLDTPLGHSYLTFL